MVYNPKGLGNDQFLRCVCTGNLPIICLLSDVKEPVEDDSDVGGMGKRSGKSDSESLKTADGRRFRKHIFSSRLREKVRIRKNGRAKKKE